MAVLGSCPESYAEYREKVRGEYSFLSEPMYIALRLKVIILLNVLCLNISIPSHMYTLFSDYSFFHVKKIRYCRTLCRSQIFLPQRNFEKNMKSKHDKIFKLKLNCCLRIINEFYAWEDVSS